MSDIEVAKSNLSGHTIALCSGSDVIVSDKRGIAPMMEFIENGVNLEGYSAADKVVGKAAAMLFVKAGIREVYAEVLSQGGLNILEHYGINVAYGMLVQNIINRIGTDICPMERTVLYCNDIDKAYELLKQKLAEISK